MKFCELKNQIPKPIRDHLYKKYQITPETKINTVEKISAKSFSFIGNSIKLFLAVHSPEKAAVIYRPKHRFTGYYPVTWVNSCGKIVSAVAYNLLDLKCHTKDATIYVIYATPRNKRYTISDTQYDIFSCDEENKFSVEKLCKYWEKIGTERALSYISQTKHWVSAQIVNLDPKRNEMGQKMRYCSNNQRVVALEVIEKLEMYEKNPYRVINILDDFETKEKNLRYNIAKSPYHKADDARKKIKNMLNRNTLERLRE